MTRTTAIKNIDRLFVRDENGKPLRLVTDPRRFARAVRTSSKVPKIIRNAARSARKTVRAVRRINFKGEQK